MSRRKIIGAIITKDLVAFTRDRFFVAMTVLAIVFYIVFFWVLPSSVDETIEIGVTGPIESLFLGDFGGDNGVAMTGYANRADLMGAVEDGSEVVAGLAFPESFFDDVATGKRATVEVIVGTGLPPEIEQALTGMVGEIAFALAGSPLPVEQLDPQQVVLGVDRTGDQIPLREQMRPLLAVLVLLVESLALAALVAEEIRAKTVQAVLVTPARLTDFLASKAIMGTLLAFSQVVLIMAAIRALDPNPALLLTAALLGSIMVTGIGLIAGSSGGDFMQVLFIGMAFLIPLMIPALAVLFPGSAATWVQIIPSYPLSTIIVDVSSFGAGWADVAGRLVLLAGWCLALLAIGVEILRRKVQTI